MNKNEDPEYETVTEEHLDKMIKADTNVENALWGFFIIIATFVVLWTATLISWMVNTDIVRNKASVVYKLYFMISENLPVLTVIYAVLGLMVIIAAYKLTQSLSYKLLCGLSILACIFGRIIMLFRSTAVRITGLGMIVEGGIIFSASILFHLLLKVKRRTKSQ